MTPFSSNERPVRHGREQRRTACKMSDCPIVYRIDFVRSADMISGLCSCIELKMALTQDEKKTKKKDKIKKQFFRG